MSIKPIKPLRALKPLKPIKPIGAGRGRPKGPAPGSGRHARDQKWREAGYLTLAETAQAVGLSVKALYNRIQDGRWRDGVHYVKALKTRNGPIYVTAAAVAALRAEVVQPPGAP